MPTNESGRVAALRALDILDTPPEPAYDEIGELAAHICKCPIGYISFIEDERLWFKSKYGLPPDFVGCPYELAFCSTTICGADLVTVPDLRDDTRFGQNPFVTGDPHLKFYCKHALITGDGYALGTLCVMDFEPRQLEFEQTESMRRPSHQVVSQLELRRRLIEYRQLDQAHAEAAA
jgi:adenylate cyclase